MVTKGVASVRSPVCNLQQYDTNITHEAFTAAVVNEFQKEYGVNEQVSLYINICALISQEPVARLLAMYCPRHR